MNLKNIALGVDFSDASKNAYHYALALAKAQGSQLQLLHYFHPDVNIGMPFMGSDITPIIDREQAQLQAFSAHRTPPNKSGAPGEEVSVTTKTILGYPVDDLIQLSKSGETDLILMSTRSSNTALDRLLGSTSEQVARRAHCPVWLVPPGARWSGISNIVYASDLSSASAKVVSELLQFSDANLSIVHVKGNIGSEYQVLNTEYHQVLHDKSVPRGYNYTTVQAANVRSGIERYLQAKPTDLLVLNTPKRGWWEGFFHKSVTKEMVLTAKVPILVFHEGGE